MWMARMENACRYQLDLLSCGRELAELSEEVQATVIEQGRKIFGGRGPVRHGVEWAAMLRKLERDSGSDWRV